MKSGICFCAVLLVGFLSSISCGQEENRPALDKSLEWTDLSGQAYDFESIRNLFESSEAIVTGTLEDRAPYSKNGTGVSPQYFLRFQDDFVSVHGGFPTFQDDGQDWQVMAYETDASGASQLKRMKREESYVVFFPKLRDENRAICIPADEGLMTCIDTWKRFGLLNQEDIAALEEQADWIVQAQLTGHRCMESYPSQDVWQFKVTKTVKGEEVPKSFEIHGSYRNNAEIPFPLKSFAKSFTLYLKKDAGEDSDVLANIPIQD